MYESTNRNIPMYTDIEKKYSTAKKKKGISLITLLKNSFSTSLKMRFFLENLSNANTSNAPRPKKPKAKPNPAANTGVLGFAGAVEYSQYAIIKLEARSVQNTTEPQKIHDQTNFFMQLSQFFAFSQLPWNCSAGYFFLFFCIFAAIAEDTSILRTFARLNK